MNFFYTCCDKRLPLRDEGASYDEISLYSFLSLLVIHGSLADLSTLKHESFN